MGRFFMRLRTLIVSSVFWLIRFVFLFVPIKQNRIVFLSFYGKQYSCNPRVIYEYLLNKQLGLDYVWVIRKESDYKIPGNPRLCQYRSLKYYLYLFTAKMVVLNTGPANDMIFRKRQVIIETWHGGGCYKKVGTGKNYSNKYDKLLLTNRSNRMTYFVSSSRYFTENTIRKFYAFKGKVLEIGMPRNDLLFDAKKRSEKGAELRKKLGYSQKTKLVLYAPTYRDFGNEYDQLKWEVLKPAFEKMFKQKDIKLLYRQHHEKGGAMIKDAIDVTSYHDMQDLLAMVDVLITDYSSSIWDYSLTRNPCFLYVPDLKKYEEMRGFDVPLEKWGFPYAKTNDELARLIGDFDEGTFIENMKKHQEYLGSFECGEATIKLCEEIIIPIMMRS